MLLFQLMIHKAAYRASTLWGTPSLTVHLMDYRDSYCMICFVALRPLSKIALRVLLYNDLVLLKLSRVIVYCLSHKLCVTYFSIWSLARTLFILVLKIYVSHKNVSWLFIIWIKCILCVVRLFQYKINQIIGIILIYWITIKGQFIHGLGEVDMMRIKCLFLYFSRVHVIWFPENHIQNWCYCKIVLSTRLWSFNVSWFN